MINGKYKSVCTGGAGFIGSHLADKLLELGHEVVVVDDLSTGDMSNVPNNATFVRLSLGIPGEINPLTEILKDADYVFHLAANPQIAAGLENPLQTHIQTVDGTVLLLDRIRKMTKRPKFILSSSCAVYGNGHSDENIKETDAINLGTPYAVQKYSQELYAQTFCKLWDIPTVILRYFNVYGTKRQSATGAYPNVIASFVKSMKSTGRIWITGDGSQSRDYVHVFDVVSANLAAMSSDVTDASVFNIGTGTTVSINDIAKHFACPVDYVLARQGDIKRACADVSKTTQQLGWVATIPFVEGLEIYFNS